MLRDVTGLSKSPLRGSADGWLNETDGLRSTITRTRAINELRRAAVGRCSGQKNSGAKQ